jgi:hypothetical protein
VAHDFRDLTGTVVWANAHPRSVELIINNANQFAERYLRREGILTYAYTLLNLYSKQLTYQPRLRRGAIPSEWVYDHARIDEICQHIV